MLVPAHGEAGHEQCRQREARGCRDVRNRGVDVVEEAAAGGADDQPELPRPGVQRDESGQAVLGGEEWGQRTDRRRHEGSRRSEHGGDEEQRKSRGRIGRGVGTEHDRGQHLDRQADRGDAATVEAVRCRAGERQQEQRREELHETQQAERELTAGDVVQLLAKCRRLQEHPCRGRRRRGQEGRHRTIGDQLSSARRGPCLRGLHRRATVPFGQPACGPRPSAAGRRVGLRTRRTGARRTVLHRGR